MYRYYGTRCARYVELYLFGYSNLEVFFNVYSVGDTSCLVLTRAVVTQNIGGILVE